MEAHPCQVIDFHVLKQQMPRHKPDSDYAAIERGNQCWTVANVSSLVWLFGPAIAQPQARRPDEFQVYVSEATASISRLDDHLLLENAERA